eukprot:s1455_g1.t1
MAHHSLYSFVVKVSAQLVVGLSRDDESMAGRHGTQGSVFCEEELAAALVALVVCTCSLDVSLEQYAALEGPEGIEASSNGFQRALADIAEAGGGCLTIPPGTWYVRPVNLTSHLVLWLSFGATLVAETALAQLPVLPALPSWGPPMSEETARREAF